jgi:hypothetical protein
MKSAPTLPPIVLGDHGFMTLYGSRLSDAEILNFMIEALAAGIPMLSGGDLRLGDIVIAAFTARRERPRWIKHMDAPLRIDGQPMPFARAMASLRSSALDRIGQAVITDEIMGPFLQRFSDERELEALHIDALQFDIDDVQRHVEAIIRSRPTIITVGGDVTDFLLACGRCDLFHELLNAISAAAEIAGSSIFLCSYLGFAWPDAFRIISGRQDVSGLMLPANVAGIGMLPSSGEVRAQCRALGKPVLAMHALAIGTLPVTTALPDVLQWPEISSAIVGASTSGHIQKLAKVQRQILAGISEQSA